MFESRKAAACVLAVSFASTVLGPVGAADEAGLRNVRGTVGYQTAKDAPFTRVYATYVIKNNELAVTQRASNGLLTLTDSSEIALGENTTIQVGQIVQAEAAAPRSITLVAGAVRFAVRHPQGARANYTFVTPISQVAVRGTDGLYSTGPGGDTVTCLTCTPGDVTVTAAGKSYPLLSGQTASISLAGLVTIAATAAAVVSSFSAAGLSTSATSATPFAPGIASAATAGVSAGAAAAAAAAVAAGAVAASTSHGQSISPTPSPQPTTVGGNATISGTQRANPPPPPASGRPGSPHG
jgi:hypothetical protein